MKTIVKKSKAAGAAMVLSIIFFSSCEKDEANDPYAPPPTINAVVRTAAGDSAGISVKFAEFRVLSGETLNNAPGALNGRREVNWDGVPANLTNNNNFPGDFFGSSDTALPNGRKRGLILTNTGTSFRTDSSDFSGIDPSYAAQFESFSKKKLFTYMGNNVTEVTFKVPGTNTNAYTKGFGVIFSDVDLVNTTTLEYFNGTKSLGVYKALPAPQGFSFVGVGFPDEKVTRVKIISGNGLLSNGVKDVSDGGAKDLVVMDDFIYSEPKSLE